MLLILLLPITKTVRYLLGLLNMSLDGKFQTNVSLNPQKSQVFTIGCLVVSGFSLMASFAFLWTGRAGWEIPLYSSAVAGGAGLICWLLSHRNSDLSDGKSTQLTAAETGMSLTFDARNQPTKQMLLMFSNYAESVAHRERLPRSSGLIDGAGKVIRNSEVEANIEIDKLNLIAAQQAESLAGVIGEGSQKTISTADMNIAVPRYTGEHPLEGVTEKST